MAEKRDRVGQKRGEETREALLQELTELDLCVQCSARSSPISQGSTRPRQIPWKEHKLPVEHAGFSLFLGGMEAAQTAG